MSGQPTVYSYLLFAAASVAVLLAFYAASRRGTPGAGTLAVIMAGVSVWSAGYALELAVTGLAAKVFWAKVEYFGIASVPVAWLAFALRYTGREGWLTRRNLAMLAVIPLVTLTLVWTNGAHGLVWSSTRLSAASPALEVGHGAWFWVHWSYSYVLLMVGSVLLVSTLARSMRLYRRQGVALLLATAAPWVGNGLYVLGLGPIPNLDLTPFAFLFSGLATALALSRFGLLDIVPVARDNVVEGMSDGVVVVDLRDRVVDVNPAAERVLGLAALKAVGQPAARLVPDWDELVEGRQSGEAQREVGLGVGPGRREYDVRLSPVVDRRGRRKGGLVLLRDVTGRRRAERALRESELRLRTVVSNAPVVLFGLDRAGVFTFSEGKGLDVLGLEPGEMVGRSVVEAYLSYPEVLEDVRRALSGEAFAVVRKVSGRIFDTRYSPLPGEGGGVSGIIGVAIDITERVRAEEERARRAAELARSNAELEQFAYSVAHDLRTPLRGIDGFSQILLEDYAGALDEEGKDYLRRVRAGTQRMGTLIDDLLSLTRVTRGEMRRAPVDLGAMAREISRELQRKQPERRARFIIPDGLTANGDAGLLKVALEHLLGNAWKFTRKKPHAEIELGTTTRDGAPAYYVRDNGAGFDMSYAGKLFGPFQRLHRADEFEGAGIGLATVQRIIHRHGGRVWAEGAPGKGATFYFTL